MSAAQALALLEVLGAAGVRVDVGQGGDKLRLSGVCPPAELLAQVKASKAALLEALTGGAAGVPPSPELGTAGKGAHILRTLPASPREGQNAPPPTGRASASPLDLPARPDWAALSESPGHCGSCARWEAAPDWGDLMGVCLAPAWAWLPDRAPLAIHTGHRCAAQGGQSYRAKVSGKRYTVSAPQPHGQGAA